MLHQQFAPGQGFAPVQDIGLRVIQFFTDYVPDGIDEHGNPKLKEYDKVEYCQMGGAQLATTIKMIREVSRVRPYTPGSDDTAAMHANAIWGTIRPLYEAWKRNEEMPVNGIPLEAWAGLHKGHVAILKQHAIRTVEELAGLGEGQRNRIPLPGVSKLCETAATYLASYKDSKISHDVAGLRDENKALQEQLAEMQKQMSELLGANKKQPESAPTKKAA
jgi:hypothetical protein